MQLRPLCDQAGLWAVLAFSPELVFAAGEGGGIADNYLVLGVAAALLAFAFTRKAGKQPSGSVSDTAPLTGAVEQPATESAEVSEAEGDAAEDQSPGEEPVAEVAESEAAAETPPSPVENPG